MVSEAIFLNLLVVVAATVYMQVQPPLITTKKLLQLTKDRSPRLC